MWVSKIKKIKHERTEKSLIIVNDPAIRKYVHEHQNEFYKNKEDLNVIGRNKKACRKKLAMTERMYNKIKNSMKKEGC